MSVPFDQLDALNQMSPTNFDALDANMAFKSSAAAQAQAQDARLFVRFYNKAVLNEEKSVAANRAIHEDKVFINIKIPGDKNNDVNRVAYPEDFQRFPMHWERFRKGQEQVIGTPLNVLPFLTEAMLLDYTASNVRTVEQLANLSDVNCQKLMGSVTHKQDAQRWLDSLKSSDTLRAEFEKKLAKQAADFQAQIDQLLAK